MSIVVTGSLAYDHIMLFKDEFRNHIMPEKTHMINVAFNVDSLQKDFGGTAGNIAYNLSLMKLEIDILAAVGEDFGDYSSRISDWGLDTKHIKVISDELTAQAFITTDLQDNQITAFHGGAMYRAEEKSLADIDYTPDIVIIAANSAQAMRDHVRHCQTAKWPYIFDPGQAMTILSAEDLQDMTKGSEMLVLNDYEWQLFLDKTSLNADDVVNMTKSVYVTIGADGVDVLTSDNNHHVKAYKDVELTDPTGAGDAFRAGLIYGFQKGLNNNDMAKYACAVASFAVECSGTQNHVFTIDDVELRKNKIK